VRGDGQKIAESMGTRAVLFDREGGWSGNMQGSSAGREGETIIVEKGGIDWRQNYVSILISGGKQGLG